MYHKKTQNQTPSQEPKAVKSELSLQQLRMLLDSRNQYSYNLKDEARNYPMIDQQCAWLNRGQQILNDDGGSVFFLRQLEFIKPVPFEVEYAELPFRRLFPVTDEGGPGAKYLTYDVFDKVGNAKVIAQMTDDLPTADVSGFEVRQQVVTLGISYRYDIFEIAASQLVGGKPLDQRRGDAAMRAVEQELNNIAFYGYSTTPNLNVPGLYNNSQIPRYAVATKASTHTAWATATPDEIIADVTTAFSTINTTSNLVEEGHILLLPPTQWNYINATPRSSLSDTTILNYIAANNQFIGKPENIQKINYAAGAVTPLNVDVPGGIPQNSTVNTPDIMIVYNKDPLKLQFCEPVPLTFLAPQQENLIFKIPGYANTAGLRVYKPLSIIFAGGI